MTVRDPDTLRSGAQRASIDGIVDALRGLYTFVKGNEYLTLGAALQITTAPAGTPVANTLYADNICKAWINFNGTGTIAIKDSFNVSGIVDNGVGDYTVTWDRDFADTNYALAIGAANNGAAQSVVNIYPIASKLVGSVQINCLSLAGAAIDSPDISLHGFGAQA